MQLTTLDSYATAVQAIEAVLGLRYPADAPSDLWELARVMDTPGFKGRFPAAALLIAPAEVAAARKDMPVDLLPFMREPQATWSDFFAFGPAGSGSPVVVWADHAVVMDWPDFGTFLHWVVAIKQPPGTGPRHNQPLL